MYADVLKHQADYVKDTELLLRIQLDAILTHVLDVHARSHLTVVVYTTSLVA